MVYFAPTSRLFLAYPPSSLPTVLNAWFDPLSLAQSISFACISKARDLWAVSHLVLSLVVCPEDLLAFQIATNSFVHDWMDFYPFYLSHFRFSSNWLTPFSFCYRACHRWNLIVSFLGLLLLKRLTTFKALKSASVIRVMFTESPRSAIRVVFKHNSYPLVATLADRFQHLSRRHAFRIVWLLHQVLFLTLKCLILLFSLPSWELLQSIQTFLS